MTDKDGDLVWHETEMLEWFRVEDFFKEHGCVMLDCPEIRWYQESWGALKRAYLASHTEFDDDDLAETALKMRAICLLAMYLGIYQAAGEHSELGGYFLGHDYFGSYLQSLNVDMEEIWLLGRRKGVLDSGYDSYNEDEEVNDEDLCEIAMELVSEDNDRIFGAIRDHCGGNAELLVF